MRKFLVISALVLFPVTMAGCSTVQAQPGPSPSSSQVESTATPAPTFPTTPSKVDPDPVPQRPDASTSSGHAEAPPQSLDPYGARLVQMMQSNGFLQIEIHFTPAQYDVVTSHIGPVEGVISAETAGKISSEAVQIGNDHLLFSKPVDGVAPAVMYAVVIDGKDK